MFEKYTDKARRAVFFARYEASKFGSPTIETEHLLLGIFQADTALGFRLFKEPGEIHAIRERIEKQSPRREGISTSVDLPVSRELRRALQHAGEESERLHGDHIANEHLLLGLLREPQCGAARILLETGVTPARVEEFLHPPPPPQPIDEPVPRSSRIPSLPETARDLTVAAADGALPPLIGREHELDRVIQILCRRTRNNPVLIGEPGVGKNAVVYGLAQRIADGSAPTALADRPVLAIDAASLISSGPARDLAGIALRTDAILYVQGLFDLAGKAAGWGALEAVRVLEPHLTAHPSRGDGLRCIATGTPAGFRLTMEKARSLAALFEVVPILPPGEEEAIRIVAGVKEEYEKFHGVTIAPEAVETAVTASRWFMRDRNLPDRAIDLIDDAAARVKFRRESDSHAAVEIRAGLRVIEHELQQAVAHHNLARARTLGDAERKARRDLEQALAQSKTVSPTNIVGREDILESLAARAGITAAAVDNLLRVKEPDALDAVARELAAMLPAGGREAAETLATFLAACTREEAEKFAAAIQAAKAKLASP